MARYRVKLNHKGTDAIVETTYLIGADGTLSRVRRSAFPGFDDNVGCIPNYEELYIGEIDLEPGWLHIFMDRQVAGYFATVFHKEDKVVVVTGANQKEPVKPIFERFRMYLQEAYGLKIKETYATHGIVLTDMSAQKNYCLGKENILLAGEAGGFLRGGEGITSSLISGKAAGDAILKSIQSKKPAFEHYKELASDEMKSCNKVHEDLTAVLGYNVFMRP